MDGATTGNEERLLIMGATNIPWGLDEAVLRRLVKRIYVPLPDAFARQALIKHLIRKHYASSQDKSSTTGNSHVGGGVFQNVNSLIFGDTRNPEHSVISPNRGAKECVPGLTEAEIITIVQLTENYSGSDLTAVCHEAAMGPIRELGFAALKTVKVDEVRQLKLKVSVVYHIIYSISIFFLARC